MTFSHLTLMQNKHFEMPQEAFMKHFSAGLLKRTEPPKTRTHPKDQGQRTDLFQIEKMERKTQIPFSSSGAMHLLCWQL